MKFILDTQAKSVTIIGTITFDELAEIKNFIGDGYKEWSIAFETKAITIEIEKEKWIPYPVYPNPVPLQPYYNPYETYPTTFPNYPPTAFPSWIVCEQDQNKFAFIGTTSQLHATTSLSE